jgi:Spy/CpxP family protein refolding chaperone
MTKFTPLALIAIAALTVTTLQAGDKSCCAAHGKGQAKMCMTETYAKLNLTEAQKTKLDALHAEADKDGGCTKESMDKFMKSAQSVLSKDQFAMLKAECAKACAKAPKA